MLLFNGCRCVFLPCDAFVYTFREWYAKRLFLFQLDGVSVPNTDALKEPKRINYDNGQSYHIKG